MRRAYLPLFGVAPTHPFHAYTEAVIDSGNVWEDQTEKALIHAIDHAPFYDGPDPGIVSAVQFGTNVPVSDDKWAGRIDFLLAGDVIVEHKDTDNGNFGRRILSPSHCLQVLMYKQLYEKLAPRRAFKTLLYYTECILIL